MAGERSLPFATRPIRPEVVRDEANDGAQAYTILTPDPEFTGIVMKRQFVRGRTVVYDVNVARQFVADYKYGCEPELPPVVKAKPKPGTSKRARIDSATFTEGALG